MADPVSGLGGSSWYEPVEDGEENFESQEPEEAGRSIVYSVSRRELITRVLASFQNVQSSTAQFVRAKLLEEMQDTRLKIQALHLQRADQESLFDALTHNRAIKAHLFIFRIITGGLDEIRSYWSAPKEIRNRVGAQVLQDILIRKEEILADPSNQVLVVDQEKLMGEVAIELQKNFQLLMQQRATLLAQQAALQRV